MTVNRNAEWSISRGIGSRWPLPRLPSTLRIDLHTDDIPNVIHTLKIHLQEWVFENPFRTGVNKAGDRRGTLRESGGIVLNSRG